MTNDTEHRCKKVRLGVPCRAGRCPAWYDGCNYSPQTCEDLIERLEASEAIKTAQALKIGHLETLVMELERENRLPCAHVGRVRVLEGEVAQLKAHTWEQERVAVAAFIVGNSIHGWAWMKASIERGEHWPAEGEKA